MGFWTTTMMLGWDGMVGWENTAANLSMVQLDNHNYDNNKSNDLNKLCTTTNRDYRRNNIK